MSSEQLRMMSMSVMQNSKAGTNIGNPLISSELRTRLSDVLVNSATCIEGLEGLEVKDIVSTGLYRAMSLVDKNLLAQVIPVHCNQLDVDGHGFPSWINEEDKKMLGGNIVIPDVVVATDGSGHYRSVMEAVSAAPDYSNKRYVIHVKKGVYAEYVKIHQKKQNIMIIGDGINATVITGNRSKVDGWTTFRSATFAVDGAGFIACNISFKNTTGLQSIKQWR
ncbi:hypothetical protein TSUD_200050 [Trifolium subterraneum]|nr:hypothetical protein TSUD_200050 [Trifolium subterraneum]